MNSASPIVASIDIGTTKICVTIARRNDEDQIEVLGIGRADSLGVMRGVVSNIDKTVDAIQKAVDEATKQAGVPIKNVYVGIAGQHVKAHQHKGYLMRGHSDNEISQVDIQRLVADMHKLALDPGESIIHVLPQEFSVDNEDGIKDPIGMSGVRLEADFHIITGQATAIRNIKRCVEKAGLNVIEMVLEPIASAVAVLGQEELEAGVALVDIGGGTTDIAIFHDGILRHTAVIPLGGDVITEDIREGCMVMKDQAEKLKVKFGCAIAGEARQNAIVSIPGLRGRDPKEISVRNLAHIIQARMEEILEYVHEEIAYSGYEGKLIGGIVVTGGGASLKYLPYLTEFISGADARIGYPNEHLINEDNEQLQDPMFATGIGLAIRALDGQPVPTMQSPKAVEEEQQAQIQEILEEEEEEVDEPMHSETVTTQTPGSWLDSLIRKGREWFEGDVKDFR